MNLFEVFLREAANDRNVKTVGDLKSAITSVPDDMIVLMRDDEFDMLYHPGVVSDDVVATKRKGSFVTADKAGDDTEGEPIKAFILTF